MIVMMLTVTVYMTSRSPNVINLFIETCVGKEMFIAGMEDRPTTRRIPALKKKEKIPKPRLATE
jgi:hypothetical protein